MVFSFLGAWLPKNERFFATLRMTKLESRFLVARLDSDRSGCAALLGLTATTAGRMPALRKAQCCYCRFACDLRCGFDSAAALFAEASSAFADSKNCCTIFRAAASSMR